MDIAPENKKILDALTAKNKAGKDYLTVSLGKLIKAFDVENKGWHDALADVTMLLDVLKAILDYLSSQEAPNIEQSKETTDTSQLSLSL